jgi:hypothetical protein
MRGTRSDRLAEQSKGKGTVASLFPIDHPFSASSPLAAQPSCLEQAELRVARITSWSSHHETYQPYSHKPKLAESVQLQVYATDRDIDGHT